MKEQKIVKARCRKTGKYYGITVSPFGTEWKAVDVIPLSADEGRVLTSQVRQAYFETNDNLLACRYCGSRRIGGCKCTKAHFSCSSKKEYNFDCIYCQEMEIDYSMGKASRKFGSGKTEITLEQGMKYQITFSNVEWRHFDKIQFHADAGPFSHIEPKEHVIADGQRIEFHGYNVSEMNEGVLYEINPDDDFEIVCDVDTTTVKQHPEGYLYIEMGPITAKINEQGGAFFLDGRQVAQVGQRFRMRLSVSKGGQYTIEIDNRQVGTLYSQNRERVEIRFGFWHESHYCENITRAYVNNIEMSQVCGGQQ